MEHRLKIPRIKEIIPIDNGIFSHMSYDGLPLTAEQMDLLFYTDFGLKTVAPLVMALKEEDSCSISEQNMTKIAAMLLGKYRNKWDRDGAVARAEYDPLHNYLDEYHEEGEAAEDETDTKTESGQWIEGINTDNTSTRTDNLTEGDSGTYNSSESGNNAQNRHGLNSATAVPVTTGTDAVTSSGSNSNTRTNTGTQTMRDVRDEDRTINDSRNGSTVRDNDKSHEKTGYHRGNIGNISTQKLLLEEIDLWRWNLADEILRDARDFLTLPMYVG